MGNVLRRLIPWYPVFCFAAVLLFGLLSEKIPVNNGLGYNASRWVERIDRLHEVFNGEASFYELQLMLPVVLVGGFLKIVGISAAKINLVTVCVVLYSFCYFGVFLFWRALAQTLSLPLQAEMFGLIALCINGILKNNMFYPTMVYEASFFFLSMGMVYYWFTGRLAAQCVLFAMSLAVNPMSVYIFPLLMIFPARPLQAGKLDVQELSQSNARWLTAAVSVVFLIVLLQADIGVFQPRNYRKISGNPFAFFSIVVAVLYCWFSLFPVIRLNILARLVREISLRSVLGLVLAVGIFFSVNSGLNLLASNAPSDWSAFTNLIQFLWVPVFDLPGYFLVNRLVSFGPVIILIALRWRAFVGVAASFGIGGLLVVCICLLRCFDTLFRQMPDVLAIAVPFAALAWRDGMDGKRFSLFLIASVFFSKLWLPMRIEYPEFYFWGYGSFVSSTTGYVVQMTAALLFLFLFQICFRNSGSKRTVLDVPGRPTD